MVADGDCERVVGVVLVRKAVEVVEIAGVGVAAEVLVVNAGDDHVKEVGVDACVRISHRDCQHV